MTPTDTPWQPGQKRRITGNESGHEFRIGEIVTVRSKGKWGDWICRNEDNWWWVDESDAELVEDAPPPRPLYELTPVDEVEGLPEGRYVVMDGSVFFEVSYNDRYSFHDEDTDCSGITHYLKPVNK